MTPEQCATARQRYMSGCLSYIRLAQIIGVSSGEIQAFIEDGIVDASPHDAQPEREQPRRGRGSRRVAPNGSTAERLTKPLPKVDPFDALLDKIERERTGARW